MPSSYFTFFINFEKKNIRINIFITRIRNERIRGTTKVGEISKKVQESRLKWYGHVSRREENT